MLDPNLTDKRTGLSCLTAPSLFLILWVFAYRFLLGAIAQTRTGLLIPRIRTTMLNRIAIKEIVDTFDSQNL